MRRFIDYRKTSELEKIGSVCTRRYIEMEIPLDTKLASIVYIIPQDTHSALVATCWENIFDQPITSLQASPYKTAYETWPIMASLFENAAKGQSPASTLLRVNDFDLDPSHSKWFVGSKVGGILCEDPASLIGERTQQAMEAVLAMSMRLLLEVQENVPGTFPLHPIGQDADSIVLFAPWLEGVLAVFRRS